MSPDGERTSKLHRVGGPLIRVKMTPTPESRADGPITDGPLIRVGHPLQRVTLKFGPVVSPAAYREHFNRPDAAPPAFSGVCGRFIRSKIGEMPTALSYTPGRKLAWAIGPDGLSYAIGKSHLEMLLTTGANPARIADSLNKGMRWLLAVFPEQRCTLATWCGVFEAISQNYPAGIAERLRRWEGDLKTGPYLLSKDELKRFDDPSVREDPGHPDHMTPERYLASPDTAANAWLLLRHSIGMGIYFSGTGRSLTADGRDGPKEYLVPNAPLDELGAVLIELNVLRDARKAGWGTPGEMRPVPPPRPEPKPPPDPQPDDQSSPVSTETWLVSGDQEA